MKEVISGSIKSSKDRFDILKSRKNSISLSRIMKIIKLKKRKKR